MLKIIQKKHIFKQNFLLFLLFISVLFISIGYAAVNSVSLDIKGDVYANAQEGLFITDVGYESSVNADVALSTVNKIYGTIMDSDISLTNSTDSEITYTVSIYNSTDDAYYFDKVVYMNEEYTYSNKNIIFKLTGLEKDSIIESKQTINFKITFYYNDITNISDTNLSSVLYYKFVLADNRVVVSLNSNGVDINYDPFIAYKGETFGALPEPTRDYYTFDGWYTKLSGGVKYTNESIVPDTIENDLTLYAKWIANPIAINNVPTITMTQNEAKQYYGQVVSTVNNSAYNPNSSDQRTWRVFYIDTENKYGDGKGTIYLKADESSSQMIRLSTTYDASNAGGYTSKFTVLSNTRYYKISGNNIVDSSGNIIDTKYLKLNPTYATGRKNISSTTFYEMEKAAAYLCDHTQFSSYSDSRANYAVGTPSVEMWIDSWNSVYGSNHKFTYQYNPSVDGTTVNQKLPGYMFSYNGGSWDQAGGIDEMDINSIDTIGLYKTTLGLWYSSPAVIYQGGSLVRLSSSGFIGNATINMSYAYSPVVSLNSNALVYTTSYSE